ncbi:hypothetical protein PCASD_02679 [Puccinia coronata f. sp. avenae]|uniref:Uncharacterized protein n=1 Tax=Puccinia coronata f. sp. avenae TaxID=200324 RepID=A0A2N5VH37_9BASI|nr:hypothetical protein PCASD_02679 [Puccinia coronata f. sp. avenae]
MSVSTNTKNDTEINSEQTFGTMPPPPKQTYTTKEDMMASLQEFACQHGFVIVTANSSFSKDSHNWVLKISNPMQNHGPSNSPSAHIMHRCMTKEMGQEISKLTSTGVQPLNIKNSHMKTGKLPINIPILAI